jgi:hypothetical protein
LANVGQADATNVTAVVAGNGVTVCTSPGSWGAIAAGGSAPLAIDFVVAADFAATEGCGTAIGFDVVQKTSTELTPAGPDELDVFAATVGQSGGTVTNDEAGTTGAVPSKATTTFATTNAPVTSTPGILTAVTVDVALTPPCAGVGNLAVSVEHDPGNDGTYEYATTIYDGTASGWSNVVGLSLPALVDGSAVGNGGWRLVVAHTRQGPSCSPDGSVDSWTLHLEASGGFSCADVSSGSCSAVAPEVSDDTAHWMKVTKGATSGRVDLEAEDVGAASLNVYVSNDPSTLAPFDVESPNGRRDCAVATSAGAPGMLGVSDYDPSVGSPTGVLFLLVTADDGPTTEGTLGWTSGAVERAATTRCAQ